MTCVIVGLLLAIGWYAGKLIYEVVSELLFERLHRSKWYLMAAGRRPVVTKEQPGDIKAVRNQIGFCYTQEKES